MEANGEIIALVLGEGTGPSSPRKFEGAQRLIRSSDGTVALERVESQEEFDRTARVTGCFKRGKAIRDPRTLEVIGYEMEEVRLV